MNYRKRASIASGGGSSKFTVQTVVVRRNSQMSTRRGRSLVDSRGCGGEDGRLVDVDCGVRSRTYVDTSNDGDIICRLLIRLNLYSVRITQTRDSS